MRYMIHDAESFNQDLSVWNVEKCKDMEYMFYGAKKFNKDSVKKWDLPRERTKSMFENGVTGEETMKEYVEDLKKRKDHEGLF